MVPRQEWKSAKVLNNVVLEFCTARGLVPEIYAGTSATIEGSSRQS